MKEMIYGERKENPDVLYSGEYKEHKFAILNLGTHPTAYIEDKVGLSGYEDFRLDGVSVHGGFTFYDTGYWGDEHKKISWLGWGYGHSGDFMGYYSTDYPFYYSSKQWTTAEIYEEVKSVIRQIIKVEGYVNSDEAKCIQTMLKDCKDSYYDYSEAGKICQTLYEKGYRKQRDTVREFVEKVLKIGSKRPLCLFNEYGEGYIDCIENIKKIAAQYGVEVEE